MLQKQKQSIREQLDALTKSREAVRTSLRDMKSSMKFTTVEDIEKEIDKLEDEIQHSTLSLTEEKKLLEEIRKLKSSRSLVGQYNEKLNSLSQEDSNRAELQSSLKQADAQLNDIKKEEEKLRSELSELRTKEQETSEDFSSLIKERDECREVCKQAYEKIKDLRAEHDAEWQQYKAAEKEWRAQQEEDRRIRREQAAAERAAREAERAARLAENAPEPFDREITMCEQLTAYLSRFQPGSGNRNSSQNSGKDTNVKPTAMDGMKLFTKKNVEDEDPWGQLAVGKGKKSKGRKAAANEEGEKLVHSLDMLEAFSVLKISVPTTASNVAKAVEEVNVQHKLYLAKREEAKENGGVTETTTGDDPAEIADAGASSSDIATKELSKKKKSSKQAAENFKLDDKASWPAVGAPSSSEIEPGEIEPNVDTATDMNPGNSVWSSKSNGTPVAVNLNVEDGHGISVAIDVA